MTEEGELKKRIDRVKDGEFKFRLAKLLIIPDDKFGVIFTPNDYLKIVDEAKKDLLESDTTDTMDIEVGAWYSVKVYVKKNTLNCDEPNFICIDYKKWKKWFGGCEESKGENEK